MKSLTVIDILMFQLYSFYNYGLKKHSLRLLGVSAGANMHQDKYAPGLLGAKAKKDFSKKF